VRWKTIHHSIIFLAEVNEIEGNMRAMTVQYHQTRFAFRATLSQALLAVGIVKIDKLPQRKLIIRPNPLVIRLPHLRR